MSPSNSPAPRIGICTGAAANNENAYSASLGYAYVRSVALAGGIPLLLPATGPDIDAPDHVEGQLDSVDALILTGGPDLPSATYGQQPVVMLEEASGPRRTFDLRLCRRALERHIPLLGICMGCQVINVALGGTLIQDLLTARPDSPLAHRQKVYPYYRPHDALLTEGTRLRAIAGNVSRILINSAHHQAVDRLGEGLRVSAVAPDGIIEAVESEDHERFLLGVQWHPEKIAEREAGFHRDIFRALVDAARTASVTAR